MGTGEEGRRHDLWLRMPVSLSNGLNMSWNGSRKTSQNTNLAKTKLGAILGGKRSGPPGNDRSPDPFPLLPPWRAARLQGSGAMVNLGRAFSLPWVTVESATPNHCDLQGEDSLCVLSMISATVTEWMDEWLREQMAESLYTQGFTQRDSVMS